MDETIKQKIEDDVKNNKIMLYMKGERDMPQCGFSAQAVGVLSEYSTPFKTFNVLSDEGIRAGIKEYAEWPTIPQLYVDGEFVGGCDIIAEMHQSGELGKVLGKE